MDTRESILAKVENYGGIHEPGFEVPRNERLVELPGYRQAAFDPFPHIGHNLDALERVLTSSGTYRGLDFEFRRDWTPTIVAVTTEDYIAALPWSVTVAERLRPYFVTGKFQWVAHSGVGADKPVIEKALKIKTDLINWECSLNTHYLVNQHLTKAPAKGESDDSGALGFMDLWTMASLTTDAYLWKRCRNSRCDGPCPKMASLDYCGVDAWAGLVGFLKHKAYMEKHNIPWDLYRESMEVNEICFLMELQGIRVDMDFIRQANADMDARKEALFDKDEHGKVIPFNPRSPKAAVEWFASHGLNLQKFDKKSVLKVLEANMKKHGYMTLEDLENETEPLPELLEMLYKSYTYKSEGSGLDKWFGSKYVKEENGGFYVHPRFVSVGTSTGRLSSSRPNFQNIAARGWGAEVRKAIIPTVPADMDILKADYSQLELRIVLWLAGVDQKVIGADAFSWLVQESGGMFDKAAAAFGGKPRDIAKSVSHGGSYGESLVLLDFDELGTPRRKKEIETGALRVYLKKYMPKLQKDWTFMGKVVAFSGVNLAERIFGDKTLENRRKALEIQEDIYFAKFFMIREWQMRVLEELEKQGYIRSATGRILRLFGADYQEWAKLCFAFNGQGGGADHVRAIMVKYKQKHNVIPRLQVHDELVWQVPKLWSDDQCKDFLYDMVTETPRLPGFTAPIEAKRGPNWKETRSLGKISAT